MQYEMNYNNTDGLTYSIFLIEVKHLQEYINGYHCKEEIEFMKNKCMDEPNSAWICKGNTQDGFIVPTISINSYNELSITDGRHRTLWMISKKMPKVPVALTHKTKLVLENSGVHLEEVMVFDIPCDIPFVDNASLEKETPYTADNLIERLKNKVASK
ncbi:TPA: hypothetical protein PXP09_000839 [Yersinia enterocolitica]|uniref:hypothetical protein n=1 Tax=Yersinia TaxID=629 RepID=UPI0005DD7064|nr:MULTISPECIES: hypothetical protein [Yersinia]MBW5817639.1 hypothetical protein [Yersinia kristensenii]CQH18224.1 Uncharacterised protein [Yersinia enterocolitica]HDL7656281.1 hypothetical protein [Yersinia enterocolitica]HDL7661101.1 hypothetical protein [Yersinia enterocolitica]